MSKVLEFRLQQQEKLKKVEEKPAIRQPSLEANKAEKTAESPHSLEEVKYWQESVREFGNHQRCALAVDVPHG